MTKIEVLELIQDCMARGYGPLFIYTELVSRGMPAAEEWKVKE